MGENGVKGITGGREYGRKGVMVAADATRSMAKPC
jgi:hypothetical protein